MREIFDECVDGETLVELYLDRDYWPAADRLVRDGVLTSEWGGHYDILKISDLGREVARLLTEESP